MRVVMTLMVRDEADVLRANLEHHLAEGVDHVVITDHRSRDHSRDIAAEYARAGVATVLDETSDVWDPSAYVTRMARMAARDLGADWVIPNDADEFWFAPRDTVASHLAALPADVSVVRVPRHDLLPVPGRGPWHERLVYRYAAPLRSDGTSLPAKVCHRADADAVVADGNHAVTGPRLGPAVTTGLRILHAQLRTPESRRRRVLDASAGYDRNPAAGPRTGWHIKEAAARARAGEFDQWWREKEVGIEELTRLVLTGEVVADHRVRDLVTRTRRG